MAAAPTAGMRCPPFHAATAITARPSASAPNRSRIVIPGPWHGPQSASSPVPYAGAMRRALIIACLAAVALAAIAPPASARPAERIVGGQPADINAMPWLVSLEADVGTDAWSCGGTIVGSHFVLTAAHCVVEKGAVIRPGQIGGVAGRGNLTAQDGTTFTAIRIAVHPGYDRSDAVEGGPYDAALLWTDVDLPYPPLALATTADAAAYAPGVAATIAGWGLTSSSGSSTDVLMSASVPIVSDRDCAASDQVSLAEAGTMVCAGFPQGGVDSCQGDSGGPLTVVAVDHPILAGIVSWGYECAAAGRPGLYTRVATLTSWIAPLLTGDEAAWVAATDQRPPRVRLYPARMGARDTTRFRYRILGEAGPTRETITVRRTRGGTVLKRLVTKAAVNPAGGASYVAWVVPRRFAYGQYVWCLTSADASGNVSALQCAPFRI